MNTDSHDVSSILKDKLLYSIQSLCEIGDELSSIEDFEGSSRAVLHLIMGTLVISKAAILLLNENTGELHVSAARGIDDPALRIKLSRDVVKALHAATEPFRVDNPPSQELQHFLSKNKELVAALKSHVWVPLRVKRSLLGVISVSKKFMDKDFESIDLELLNIIAQQLSIAVNDFRLIRSLRDTNFQLNRKILELETLYDLGIAISSLLEVNELYEQILINAVGLTDASAGLLALRSGDRIEVSSSINLTKEGIEALELYEPLKSVWEGGESLVDNQLDPAQNPFGFSKLLVVPLKGQHQVLGIIGLADKESREGGLLDFTEDDQRLLTSFGTQAGVSIENAKFYAESVEKERLERELQVAATIQENLLPDSPPKIPGYEIAATTIPSRTVGGDYYDFLVQDGLHMLSIADVSGKGIPAALLVSTLHATLHAHAEGGEWELKQLVSRISMGIYASSLSNKFITFVLGIIDPQRNTLTYINAGHNYPLVISADGGIRQLQTGGLCLGLLPNSDYKEEQVQLNPGDVFVLYTDGITESFNAQEEEFGEERLKQVLLDNRRRTAVEIFDAILQAVADFNAGAPQHDDMTLVVGKVLLE
jgi:sigma-B regulation protein RsbU (phosphoserine phosphatase)